MKKEELRRLAKISNFKIVALAKETIFQCRICLFKREVYNDVIKRTDEIADFSRHSKWHMDNPNKDYAEYEKEQLSKMNREINERLAPLFKRLRF